MAKTPSAPKRTTARKPKSRTPTDRLRDICLALPEAEERETWEIPTYRIRGRIFALQSAIDDRDAVWCKAQEGSQELLVQADSDRFFKPPYLGHKGWVGMWLDRKADWKEVAELVTRSYRLIAPKKLVARLEAE
jgi:predicted DNA-binding protein (MmcQ/YjbR family)